MSCGAVPHFSCQLCKGNAGFKFCVRQFMGMRLFLNMLERRTGALGMFFDEKDAGGCEGTQLRSIT